MDILPKALLIILLILMNGFFVASEFSLIAIRKTRIDELSKKKNRSARMVKKALENIGVYISAIQLGVTAASLALGWIGEPAVAHVIQPYFSFLPQEQAVLSAHGISVIIAFTFITYLTIVLGELIPKTFALQKAEAVSLFAIVPLSFFVRVFNPFIWLLTASSNVIKHILGLPDITEQNLVHSEDEIKMILNQSEEGGALEEEEVEMVYNVFRLGDISVNQIMVPRTDIIAFSSEMPLMDLLKEIEKNLHSRYPVYEESIDTIVGFIHIKDVYKHVAKRKENKTLKELHMIRDIIHVPETKLADDVLLEMRKKRIHIAVINDEYGGTAGMVTLEDIIENLVGEIHDEFDVRHKDIRKQRDGSYLVDGLTPLDKAQTTFSLPVQGKEYTTIGGLVFGLLGRQPIVGDTVTIGDIQFTVEKIDGKRIETLRVKPKRQEK